MIINLLFSSSLVSCVENTFMNNRTNKDHFAYNQINKQIFRTEKSYMCIEMREWLELTSSVESSSHQVFEGVKEGQSSDVSLM